MSRPLITLLVVGATVVANAAMGLLGESSILVGRPALVQTSTEEALTDREILVAFYNSTGGANWTNNMNWLSDKPLREWQGVTTGEDGRVRGLSFRDNNLTGSIPSELGGLSLLLVELLLNNNRLSGSIPPELGGLSNLKVLNLMNNRSSGCIPATLMRPGLALSSGLPCTYYDSDSDGLIEVSTLAQLDAIRFDLDGDGSASDTGYAAVFPGAASGMGCPFAGCIGYDLVADLDFDTDDSVWAGAGDAYWNEGADWTPIGRGDGNGFSAVFGGKGRAIDSLYVKTIDANAGLFSVAAEGGTVRNVRLESVALSGETQVGRLAGQSNGTLSGIRVTGNVTGRNAVGGLAGVNRGAVQGSYATSSVSGRTDNTGGLVGFLNGGSIVASYASGPVSSGGSYVGGLVGSNWDGVTASYAVGSVVAGGNGGGLVGHHGAGTVTASYWDRQASGKARSFVGQDKTTTELQEPTGYTGIYAGWHVDLDGDGNADDPWDFGTTTQYPALR